MRRIGRIACGCSCITHPATRGGECPRRTAVVAVLQESSRYVRFNRYVAHTRGHRVDYRLPILRMGLSRATATRACDSLGILFLTPQRVPTFGSLFAPAWAQIAFTVGPPRELFWRPVPLLNQPPLFDSINTSTRFYDFHLNPASPAINFGINAGITIDLDGNSRPIGLPDLGSYEHR